MSTLTENTENTKSFGKEVLYNRCYNTGIERNKPFLSLKESEELRKKADAFIDNKIKEWNATVPFAQHFEKGDIQKEYYTRHLIETAWRIRLLRVVESKALAEIAKITPEGAQIWAHYEMEEMPHDELFLNDLRSVGVDPEKALKETEPYLSTKLLTGFFSYLLDHEGPMGVVAYSYLVEYVNVKLDPEKNKGLKKCFGEEKVKGQLSHTNTDDTEDHPGEVWKCLRYLIRSEQEIQSLFRYFEEHQQLLAMFFAEIHQDIVTKGIKNAA